MQRMLFDTERPIRVERFTRGLLKWIGNKQRIAHEIVAYFPPEFNRYIEPFAGSAAVLGTLAPDRALASDTFRPLIEIWMHVRREPGKVKRWYSSRYHRMMKGDKREEYERVKADYNRSGNPADLLFLCRTCYAGVVRFRQSDGFMSTPCGPHNPMTPDAFASRVDEWHRRISGTDFEVLDFREALARALPGDLVYCDPPYTHSQAILYGAQGFRLRQLLGAIGECKRRGVHVALSIDGVKQSGRKKCHLDIPDGLFEREILIDCGRSMLRRLQMGGQTLEGEVVADRLLLTY